MQAENEGEVGAEGQDEEEDAQGGSGQVIEAVEIGDVQERKEEEEAQGPESALIEPDVVTVGQPVDASADELDAAEASDSRERAEDDAEGSGQEAHPEEQTALVDFDSEDEKGQSVSSESGAQEQEASEDAASDGDEKEQEQDADQPNHEAAESSEQESGSGTQSVEPQPFDVGRYDTSSENVDYGLLQKQATYIVSSNMLNTPEFQQLVEPDKVNAVLSFLNSNPETAFQAFAGQVAQPPNPQRASQHEPRPDLSQPMTAVERKRYNEYLRGENRITEIQNIPPKSRLFIGNLPLKNVA